MSARLGAWRAFAANEPALHGSSDPTRATGRMRRIHGIHFVGIGGAGMSGIAEILLEYELEVSGCDHAASEVTDRLHRLGATVAIGHSADHLDGVELVVISSAVAESNPEVEAARQRGIPPRLRKYSTCAVR